MIAKKVHKVSSKTEESTEEPHSEIRKAVITFVCPDTDALVVSNSLDAQAEYIGDNKIKILVTVDCAVCNKAHTVTAVGLLGPLADHTIPDTN